MIKWEGQVSTGLEEAVEGTSSGKLGPIPSTVRASEVPMSRKRRIPRFLRITLAIVAVLVGIYAVAGFVVAPRVLQSLLVDKAHELFGLEATVQSIRLNPFSLSLRVDHLDLRDSRGSQLLALEELAVQVSGSSVTRRAIILSHVELIRPHLNVEVFPDSSLNLEPLFHPTLPPPDPTQQENPEPGDPLRVGVERLRQSLCLRRSVSQLQRRPQVEQDQRVVGRGLERAGEEVGRLGKARGDIPVIFIEDASNDAPTSKDLACTIEITMEQNP